jgi:putative ABC transport system substrate-binding protein
LPAQQTATPVIGFLNGGAQERSTHLIAAFRRGLNEAGFVEGQNVTIEYRWAEGHYDRLPALAAELVRRSVNVLVGSGGAAIAAKASTSSIPVLFVTGSDPVSEGLVSSLGRPGGNTTGLTMLTLRLEEKRLGLLREVVPDAATLAALINPKFRWAGSQLADVREGASRAGMRLVVLNASTEHELGSAFARLKEERAAALVICADPFFNSLRRQLAALTVQHRIPAIYEWREFAEAGGLMSYGTSLTDAYRQIGVYTGRILKGARPAELPVLRPVKLELVINLKTARTLGLTISPTIVARADEVIE